MRTIEKIIRELILVTLFSCVSLGYSQKYWVGGQGKWSDENHWSKTSGGVGGSVIPNEYQEAIFDKNSGLKYLDSVVVDGYAEVKSLNFSSLPFPIIFKGSESSSLFITDKIIGEAKFVNQFNGMVHMDGSESNYRYKMFDSGEFYGKQSFFDVYRDVNADFQTLTTNKLIVQNQVAISTINSNLVSANVGVFSQGLAVGTTDLESYTLNVDGAVRANSATFTDFLIVPTLSVGASGADTSLFVGDQKVGIGTNLPDSALHVISSAGLFNSQNTETWNALKLQQNIFVYAAFIAYSVLFVSADQFFMNEL